MTPTEWDLVLKQGIPFALVIVFIMGLVREWWVMGTQHREMKRGYEERLADISEERDRYRELALGAVDIGQQTVEQIGRERGRR